jgi:drug/metabolite transporter (DMT)-like permease
VITVVLGLIGAAVYGASDFFGGMAARAISAIRVTAIASGVALVLTVVLTLFTPTRWSFDAFLWGGIAGLAGAGALMLLYTCLALGPMSILAPMIALVSAVVPIGIGFARGERLSFAGNLGLVVGLVAVILICFVPGAQVVRPSLRGMLYAIAGGLFVGIYLVCIDLTPTDSGPAPLVVTMAASGLVMVIILAVQRIRGPFTVIPRSTLLFAIACGATDAIAAFLFLLALRSGDLSVVSVLNALAPAGTIVLAGVILRERVAVVQWVGLVVAIGAAALLALA